MSTNVAANLLAITGDQIISHFKAKGAVSKDTAVVVNMEELRERLDVPEFVTNNFADFTFVKATAGGKYYIDETEIKKQKKVVLYVLFAMAVIMIMPLIFGLIGYLQSL